MVKILSEDIANKIAAGEVVESPASVVKELIENSIDANATRITVEIKNGGKELIKICDDGDGIEKDDLQIIFKRYATGKISKLEDIYNINTLGYRGEALASISSVSKVELISRYKTYDYGYKVFANDKQVTAPDIIGTNVGTSIFIRDLFYNTPARFNFMKSTRSENNKITDLVDKLAIANPNISFTLNIENKQLYKTDGRNNVVSTLAKIYGIDFIKDLIEIKYSDENIKINGYISKIDNIRGFKKYQMVFVNNRYVIDNIVSDTINDFYKNYLPNNRFPVFIIWIELDNHMIDINVSPNKTKVLFKNYEKIQEIIRNVIDENLNKLQIIKNMDNLCENIEEYHVEQDDSINFEQNLINNNYNNKNEDENYSEKIFLNNEKNTKILNFLKNKSKENKSEEFILTKDWSEKVNEKEEIFDIELDDIFVNEFFEYFEAIEKEEIKFDFEEQNIDIFKILENLEYITQLFDSVILTKYEDKLFFVNQYGLYQRILYDEIVEIFKTSKFDKQILLEPFLYKIEVDSIKIYQLEKILSKIGFDFKILKENIEILSIPVFYKTPVDINFIIYILDYIFDCLENNLKINEYEIIDDYIKKIIRKNTISKKLKITDESCKELLNKLKFVKTLRSPYNERLIYSISEDDILKKFI